MTHQEIADRIECLQSDFASATRNLRATQEAERLRLIEACSRIGHVFRTGSFWNIGSHFVRTCAICDAMDVGDVAEARAT